jgi:protein-S-isoprenylcysteine O-methyltransferase Ste14
MALQEEFEKQGIWLFRYRSFIPFIVLVAGAYLFIYTELNPGNILVKQSPYDNWFLLLSMLVCFLGFGIRVYTVGHTPVNTSGRNAKYQIADQLNTTGIYSIVRHPLYLGNFFMWLGPILLTAHAWFILVFVFFYWVYYERIMFSEEQFLRRKFGEVYTGWAENVPAFIPKFSGFIPPSLPFSWKKILKKEKNGFAAIFIIFSLMNIAGELVKGETGFNLILFGFCAASCILYLILKYLKWRTNVLNEEGR